jgi:hypothetical protein
MANIQIKDGAEATKYFSASGDGTNEVPFVPVHTVYGNVAHDIADTGNPVKVGGVARSTNPSVVASGDRSDLMTDLIGRLVVSPYSIPENIVSGVTAAITGTADTAVIAAQGAGVRIYVTQMVILNTSATATLVNIKDGTTTIYTVNAPATSGQIALTFPVPLRLTANNALNVACGTTAANVIVSASGYKGA